MKPTASTPKNPAALQAINRRSPRKSGLRHLRQRPYDKNKTLNAWRDKKRLMQVVLSTYSPSLNLMERLWKFLRQQIINTSFYPTKGQIKTAVLDFFDQLPEFDPELTFRMSLKFHVLDSQSQS